MGNPRQDELCRRKEITREESSSVVPNLEKSNVVTSNGWMKWTVAQVSIIPTTHLMISPREVAVVDEELEEELTTVRAEATEWEEACGDALERADDAERKLARLEDALEDRDGESAPDLSTSTLQP